MIIHAILGIGIIRALNETARRLFRAATQHRQNKSDNQSKKDSKDQESIQSSTIPVPGYSNAVQDIEDISCDKILHEIFGNSSKIGFVFRVNYILNNLTMELLHFIFLFHGLS